MKKLSLLLSVFSCCLFSCALNQETEPKEYSLASSVSASDISESGVTFSAVLNNAETLDFSDHGFIWSTDPQTLFNSSDRISLGTTTDISTFNARVSTRLKEGERYYARSFVEFDELRILSDTISFVSSGSDGPELISFQPKIANVGDNITLIGKGFSSQIENNVVSFNNHRGFITKSSLDTIVVVVPEQLMLEESEITVEVAGEISTYSDSFRLFRPSIDQLSATQYVFGDTIEIHTGNPIPTIKSQIKIELEYENGSRTEIKGEDVFLSPLRFVVPFDISANRFKVVLKYNGSETISTESLQLAAPSISELSTTELKYGDELRIVSDSFSTIPENNKIYLGEVQLYIHRMSVTPENRELSYVEVIIPTPIGQAYSARSLPIRVEVMGIEGFSDNNVKIINQWFRLKNSPFTSFEASLSYDQKGYVYTDNKILTYQPEQDEWSTAGSFPGESRSQNAFFAISGNIYLGLGRSRDNASSSLRDIWQYSIENDLWNQLSDFPGSNRIAPVSFGYQTMGYLGLGYRIRDIAVRIYINEFWSFNPTNLMWTRLSDYPISHRQNSYGISRNGLFLATRAISDPIQLNRYIPETNEWDYITSFPGPSSSNSQDIALGFLENDIWLYLFANTTDGGSSQGVDRYNTETQMWTGLERSLVDKTHLFNINGKMYFLRKNNFKDQFWEFDPNPN